MNVRIYLFEASAGRKLCEQSEAQVYQLSYVDFIINDWDDIVQEIKGFADIALAYRGMAGFQLCDA